MSIIKRRADLVQDIVNETEKYKSWDILEMDTWDAVHETVDEVLQVHLKYSMMEYAQASVGLDQTTRDRIWIEVEVTWDKARDADSFIIIIKSDGTFKDPQALATDYDRAMGVV